jgi:capsular exopolysaccharide synthesis family protein
VDLWRLSEDRLDVRRLWKVIRKRRWLVGAVFALVFGGIALYTFLSTPIYRAETVLLIEPRSPEVTDIPQVLAEALGANDQDFLRTQYDILRSRSLAAEVIGDVGLREEPAAGAPGEAHPSGVHPALVETYVGRWLVVSPIRGTRLVKIQFGSPSPELAARVANAHARAYIRRGQTLRRQASAEAREFLEETLAELEPRVEQAEKALNDFRREKGVVSFDGQQDPDVGRYSELHRRLADAEAERIGLEADIRLIRQGRYDSLPAVLHDPVIRKLKEQLALRESEYAFTTGRLRPSAPQPTSLKAQVEQARDALRTEIERVVEGIRSGYLAARRRESDLRALAEGQRAAALGLNEAAAEYVVLEREAEANRQLYERVRQRMKEMSVVEELPISNVAVVDPAYPPLSPAKPKVPLNLAIGVLLGLVAGLGAGFSVDYLDNRLKTPDEVERYLALPSLGVVPDFQSLPPRTRPDASPTALFSEVASLRERAEGPGGVVLSQASLSAISEAYRSVRTSLLLSGADEPPRTVLFTSATRGEGKTTTTLYTAFMFAQLGEPVLVIDADLRVPSCHQIVGTPNEPGLTEFLSGRVSEPSLTRIGETRLHLLPSGAHPPHPTELLGSEKMRELLRSMRKQYAYVLIDAPPLIPVSDAVVLSTLVEGVVVVVDATQPPRQAVREARARLAYARANVLGVVLNRIDASMDPYGYYGEEEGFRL